MHVCTASPEDDFYRSCLLPYNIIERFTEKSIGRICLFKFKLFPLTVVLNHLYRFAALTNNTTFTEPIKQYETEILRIVGHYCEITWIPSIEKFDSVLAQKP